MINQSLILVDNLDNPLGIMDKLEAHQKGLLHRAFSVFIWNKNKELLIHKRAANKYHSANLWTNTCCSHPQPNEATMNAAKRRLQEEVGFSTDIQHRFHFIYKTELENNLIEHELDHVFIGEYNGDFTPNPDEISETRWISIENLKKEIETKPDNFTYWFKEIISKYEDKITL
jgi:isopentenyl-diphosphate delta-isomerase